MRFSSTWLTNDGQVDSGVRSDVLPEVHSTSVDGLIAHTRRVDDQCCRTCRHREVGSGAQQGWVRPLLGPGVETHADVVADGKIRLGQICANVEYDGKMRSMQIFEAGSKVRSIQTFELVERWGLGKRQSLWKGDGYGNIGADEN